MTTGIRFCVQVPKFNGASQIRSREWSKKIGICGRVTFKCLIPQFGEGRTPSLDPLKSKGIPAFIFHHRLAVFGAPTGGSETPLLTATKSQDI